MSKSKDCDLFAGVPVPPPGGGVDVSSSGTGQGSGRLAGRETLVGLSQTSIIEYAEELQKECRLLDNENKFLTWELRSNLTFFSRATKLAHRLNTSSLDTVVDVALNEMAGFFRCRFAAFFVFRHEGMRFELAGAMRGADAADSFENREEFLSKLFIERSDAYFIEFDPESGCLTFEDGERFECGIPEKWAEVMKARALVFPLRVKRPDSPEPHVLGGLILGDSDGKLEGRDADAAQFYSELLSSSLHNAQLVERLNRLTIIDPLTNIYNRRHLLDQLGAAMNLADRHRHDLCIVMLDIDYFKIFNDNYGHIYGDEVLREVAALLKNGLRTGGDLAARYGGEEFLLVMPFTGLDTAVEVADRLRRSIREHKIRFDHVELGVTCSFGVAQYISGEALEKFIDRADIALYQAKNAGRDQVAAASGY